MEWNQPVHIRRLYNMQQFKVATHFLFTFQLPILVYTTPIFLWQHSYTYRAADFLFISSFCYHNIALQICRWNTTPIRQVTN